MKYSPQGALLWKRYYTARSPPRRRTRRTGGCGAAGNVTSRVMIPREPRGQLTDERVIKSHQRNQVGSASMQPGRGENGSSARQVRLAFGHIYVTGTFALRRKRRHPRHGISRQIRPAEMYLARTRTHKTTPFR